MTNAKALAGWVHSVLKLLQSPQRRVGHVVDMRVSERREKGVDRKQKPTEAIGHQGSSPAHGHPGPHTHTPLTPSVKKLRSIRKLGTRFGRRLGSKDRE